MTALGFVLATDNDEGTIQGFRAADMKNRLVAQRVHLCDVAKVSLIDEHFAKTFDRIVSTIGRVTKLVNGNSKNVFANLGHGFTKILTDFEVEGG